MYCAWQAFQKENVDLRVILSSTSQHSSWFENPEVVGITENDGMTRKTVEVPKDAIDKPIRARVDGKIWLLNNLSLILSNELIIPLWHCDPSCRNGRGQSIVSLYLEAIWVGRQMSFPSWGICWRSTRRRYESGEGNASVEWSLCIRKWILLILLYYQRQNVDSKRTVA